MMFMSHVSAFVKSRIRCVFIYNQLIKTFIYVSTCVSAVKMRILSPALVVVTTGVITHLLNRDVTASYMVILCGYGGLLL